MTAPNSGIFYVDIKLSMMIDLHISSRPSLSMVLLLRGAVDFYAAGFNASAPQLPYPRGADKETTKRISLARVKRVRGRCSTGATTTAMTTLQRTSKSGPCKPNANYACDIRAVYFD